MPLVLAWLRSTHWKARSFASSLAIALKVCVSLSTFACPPKSAAAGTYDQVGIETATTLRPGVFEMAS